MNISPAYDDYSALDTAEEPEILRAILLDDSQFETERIRRMAAQTNSRLEIETATNLHQFNQRLDKKEYDVALIDYLLPEGDGLDALRLLKEHPVNSNAASIMITGNAGTDIAVRALKCGCDDFLQKSNLGPERLRSAVYSAICHAAGARAGIDQTTVNRTTMDVLSAISDACLDEMQPVILRMLRLLKNLGGQHASLDTEELSTVTDLHRDCQVLATQIIEINAYIQDYKRRN